MADLVVTDRHIRHAAIRAPVRLILRGQKNGKTSLAEPTPTVLQHIAFEKNTFRILQFKVIFHYERPAGNTAYKARLSLLPDQGLEEMIASDLNVCRRSSAGTSAKQNVFARAFQKIVQDLIRTTGTVPTAASNCLRVCARPGRGNTMEVRKIRIDHCKVCGPIQMHAPPGLILRVAVQPNPINYNLCRGVSLFGCLHRQERTY